jgi:glucoside 3-dehydrogenase (cytochrome c) hitch-hiker subunit
MDRREALRLLVTAAAIPLTTPKVFAVLREARALLESQQQRASGTLNSHQNLTVTAIAEMIIPRTETPGATDAGVPAFIDLIVTEWYTDQERARFLGGLADVDTRSQRLFSKNFVECSQDQQAEILTALGAKMLADADGLKGEPEPPGVLEAGQNFYSMLRNLVLTGYYTSEAGATAELNYQIIPDRFDACAEIQAGKEAAKIQ